LKSIFTTLCLVLLASPAVFAEYQWGFADLNLNYLNWDKGTEEKSTKTDFTFLEIEGGAQHSWGELYGFYDVENVGKTGDEMRTAAKGSARYYLGNSNISLYAHVYNFTSQGFAEQNRVVGFGYQFVEGAFWFKPFLGVHEVSQTFFNGYNGFMTGWVLGYSFKVNGQSLAINNWHEIEFARREAYALSNGNSKTSHNGAASIWWNVSSNYSLGLQWRYAVDKLGTAGTMNATITTLKYSF
jgi:hypothetical protein